MIHAICLVFTIKLSRKPLIDANGLSDVFDFDWALSFRRHGVSCRNNILDLQHHS